MLGKLRKGDRVYTVLNNDPAGCVTVSEVLKLDKEVILVRGVNDRNEKVALSPKEILTFKYKDEESVVESKQEGTISETGSLRYNTGKPQMSNIPPEFLLEMAKVMTMGAEKYGKNNYKKGNKVSIPYDSLQRHLLGFIMGEDLDIESKCHHMAHVAVNAMMIYYYHTKFPEYDDREEMN